MRRRSLFAVLAVSVLLTLSGGLPARAVVNGSAAQPNEFPFMASIQDTTGFAFCGGSVIAARWILTAAHCVETEKVENLQVVTGRTDLSDTSTGQVLAVTEIHVHPGYQGNGFDAALLKLASPTTSPAIKLAGSADDDLEAAGTPVTVAGWGDTLPTLGLFSTNELQYTNLNVVSDDDCALPNPGFDAPTGVCAAEFLTDSCNGDSGGPLWALKSGARIQIGIVSYGNSCAVPESPGVYSEVNNPSIRSFISGFAGV
jgi:secreted trypsin-like serine protease